MPDTQKANAKVLPGHGLIYKLRVCCRVRARTLALRGGRLVRERDQRLSEECVGSPFMRMSLRPREEPALPSKSP